MVEFYFADMLKMTRTRRPQIRHTEDTDALLVLLPFILRRFRTKEPLKRADFRACVELFHASLGSYVTFCSCRSLLRGMRSNFYVGFVPTLNTVHMVKAPFRVFTGVFYT